MRFMIKLVKLENYLSLLVRKPSTKFTTNILQPKTLIYCDNKFKIILVNWRDYGRVHNRIFRQFITLTRKIEPIQCTAVDGVKSFTQA